MGRFPSSAVLWPLVSPRGLTKSPDRSLQGVATQERHWGVLGASTGNKSHMPYDDVAEQRERWLQRTDDVTIPRIVQELQMNGREERVRTDM